MISPATDAEKGRKMLLRSRMLDDEQLRSNDETESSEDADERDIEELGASLEEFEVSFEL